jgi:prolyl-tRNA synthetase
MIMGCYGLAPRRTVAACIEQNHDENGLSGRCRSPLIR